MAQLNINGMLIAAIFNPSTEPEIVSTSVTKPQLPRVTTSCPPPSRVFRGRQDILKKMHNYFSENVGKRHVCLLHGLGGAGKTQICLKFVDETAKARWDISCSSYL
jgi:primosomal protein N'